MLPTPRGNGNGHGALPRIRGILRRGLFGLPRGPFNVAQVIDVLESFDYHAEPRDADEVLMFHRVGRTRPIPVDPDWSDFWEDSAIFNCLCADLGIGADELTRRLNASRH